MEQLKNLGQRCRQHYEKLVLSFVLLLLAAAVWYLFGESQKEKEKIRQIPIAFENKSRKKIAPVTVPEFESTMREATNPPALQFSGKHNLFNPVKWQQSRAGGPIIKVLTGRDAGVEAMQIVKILPLLLSIGYDRAATSGSPPDIVVTGYHMVITNEVATLPRLRRISQFVTTNATNTAVFILAQVKGPPEAPTELVALLRDYNNERISFAPGKPYTRPVGYEVELKYPPSGRIYPRLRKDAPLDIEGEPYKVIDIAPNKVVLSDNSNGKRYSIDLTVAP